MAKMFDVISETPRGTDPSGRVGYAAFDLINGLAGVVLLALAAERAGVGDGWKLGEYAVYELDQLCRSTYSRDPEGYLFIGPHALVLESERAMYPSGYVNLGVAHGVPGPMLALSLGATFYGNQEARKTASALANQLVNYACGVHDGVSWCNGVGSSPQVQKPPIDRFAWCYGTPGIARVLYIVGGVLGEPDVSALAKQAGIGVAQTVLDGRRIPGLNLCHGMSGLTQILARFYSDTGETKFKEAAIQLGHEICDAFRSDSPVGFVEVVNGVEVHNPDFLQGSIGVLLALLALVDKSEPTWDWVMALSAP